MPYSVLETVPYCTFVRFVVLLGTEAFRGCFASRGHGGRIAGERDIRDATAQECGGDRISGPCSKRGEGSGNARGACQCGKGPCARLGERVTLFWVHFNIFLCFRHWGRTRVSWSSSTGRRTRTLTHCLGTSSLQGTCCSRSRKRGRRRRALKAQTQALGRKGKGRRVMAAPAHHGKFHVKLWPKSRGRSLLRAEQTFSMLSAGVMTRRDKRQHQQHVCVMCFGELTFLLL